MAKTKQSGASLGEATKPITLEPPVVLKYKVLTVESKLADGIKILEDSVSEWMAKGWKPQGGIDVKSTSVSGWLFTQAMIRE